MGICFECGSLKQGDACPSCDGPSVTSTPLASPSPSSPSPIFNQSTPVSAPPPVIRSTPTYSSPSPQIQSLGTSPQPSQQLQSQPQPIPTQRTAAPVKGKKKWLQAITKGVSKVSGSSAHISPSQSSIQSSSQPSLQPPLQPPLQSSPSPSPSPSSSPTPSFAGPLPPRPPKPSASTSTASISQPTLSSSPSQPAIRSNNYNDDDAWDRLVSTPNEPPLPSSAPPPVSRANKPNYNWNELSTNAQLRQEHYDNLKVDTQTSAAAVQRAREIMQIGNATLQDLSSQAYKIDSVERDVESIHMQLDRGDRHLRSIEGVTGTLSNLVTRDKNDNNMYFARSQNNDHSLRQYDVQPIDGSITAPTSTVMDSNQPPLTAEDSLKRQLEQQDRDLEELSRLMMGLQGIATTMNTELSRQNEQIDFLNVRTSSATEKTHGTNYRINKLM